MTTKDRDALIAQLNNMFNETVKYMQFRFAELAQQVLQLPIEDEKSDKNAKMERIK